MSDELPKYGAGARGFFSFNQATKEMEPVAQPRKLVTEAPSVITDEIEPIVSHATYEGKVFTSKSAYRRHLKENGFRETGGEHLKDVERLRPDEQKEERERREDIERAYYDVKYDRVEFTELEKENHKREERLCKGKQRIKSPY